MPIQIAELRAGVLALEQATELLRTRALGEGQLSAVAIKADSEYLITGMADWVFKVGDQRVQDYEAGASYLLGISFLNSVFIEMRICGPGRTSY